MWKVIYRAISYVLLLPALFFLLGSKKTRKSILGKFRPKPNLSTKEGVIWIHAASLGEAVIGLSVSQFLSERTDFSFLFTTNTTYAKDFIERHITGRGKVLYAPLDLSFSLDSFLEGVDYRALLIIETEIWPNMIWKAKSRAIPILIVNGRVSDRSFPLYRKISFFIKHVLRQVDLVLAQSDVHAQRFSLLGVPKERIFVLGNIKYLRKPLFDFSQKDHVITFGSIRRKEIDGIIEVMREIKNDYPDISFFFAPREITALEVIEKSLAESFRIARLSFIKEAGGNPHDWDVILIDTVGEMDKIYAQSLLAFVGGSLAPYGGHNILEPIFCGTPVLFGPYVENFKEIANDILAFEAGFMVGDYEELKRTILRLLSDVDLINSVTKNGRVLVERRKDEIEKKMEVLLEFIERRRN